MGGSIRISRHLPCRALVTASFSLLPFVGQQQQQRAVRQEHGDDRVWRRTRRSTIDSCHVGYAEAHNVGRKKLDHAVMAPCAPWSCSVACGSSGLAGCQEMTVHPTGGSPVHLLSTATTTMALRASTSTKGGSVAPSQSPALCWCSPAARSSSSSPTWGN